MHVDRLLLPKIDYIDCSWEEFQTKLFQIGEQKSMSTHNDSEQTNNQDKNLSIDINQQM